jgi:hypothetical protein
MKDWTGNKRTMSVTLGASNHFPLKRAEHDYYATDPKALRLLLEVEDFTGPIWEPACGGGHLSEVLKERGYHVYSSDLIDRGYGEEYIDFLSTNRRWKGDIITNPPYKYAKDFIIKALNSIEIGNRVCMFLRLQFLEGIDRGKLYAEFPPKFVYVSRSRIGCPRNGDFNYDYAKAVAYSWFIWEKGYKGDTIIRWYN